jgi:hypothetical protein
MGLQIDKDFALLYGIMLGDGGLSLAKRRGRKTDGKFITITGSSVDDVKFFGEVVRPLLKKYRNKDTNLKYKRNCNAIEYNFIDQRLFDFVASVGFPIGLKGNRLFIPKIFYDLKLVEQIIAGFFATDGSLVLTKNPNKYYPRLEIRVISVSLLKEVYSYLLSLGFKGGFYECKRSNVHAEAYNCVHTKYRIQL